MTRSFFGATLPLAGPAMYAALTPQWAGTLLALLEAIMIPIPIVFYRYGARIRARSKIISQLRREQEKNERQAERTRHRKAGRGDGAPDEGGVAAAGEQKVVFRARPHGGVLSDDAV